MSLGGKQIDELRAYAKDRKGEIAELVSDAADTIELLSAKLSAANMERSSQYYHDGWIPCDERMPEKGQWCLVSDKGHIAIDTFIGNGNPYNWHWYVRDYEAWMPLPAPYRKEGEQHG